MLHPSPTRTSPWQTYRLSRQKEDSHPQHAISLWNIQIGRASCSVFFGWHVLRNTFVPWDCKHAMNSPFGLVILIGSVAWYGLSCTSVLKFRNWLVLINVWSMSFIYKASLKTNIYCLPVVDVNPVVVVIIGIFFMGSYVSEKGATLHYISV